MNKKTILIGLGVLAVAGIGYYMWKKKSEKTSEITAGGTQEGGVKTCVTTCESTPTNPNQAPTVYAGACPPVLANQPYAGYKTVTRCGGAERVVKSPIVIRHAAYFD